MHVALIIAASLALLAWIYLFFLHGGFWRFGSLLAPQMPPVLAALRIVAVVPARNEAESVGEAVKSLLTQQGTAPLHVVLVDDASTDATAEAARAGAEQISAEGRLTVIVGAPLPLGWTGKLWAVQQGVGWALELKPDYLLLTDADVAHAPGAVANLAAIAERGDYDLASLMVRLPCQAAPEKLLIPAFVFFFFKLYPPRWIANPRRTTAGAAGGCMLVRPQALAAAGGVAAIRDQIIDDCALARAIKRSGGRVWLGLAQGTASLRPYSSFAGLGSMIARAAFSQLQHSVLLLLGALAGMCLLYLLPVALLFSGNCIAGALAGVGYLLMLLCYLPAVRYCKLNPLWTLTLPLAALFYSGATVHSAISFWAGRGGRWKGRVQDPGARTGA